MAHVGIIAGRLMHARAFAERLPEATSDDSERFSKSAKYLQSSVERPGGPQGSRTPDLRRAKAALSQLS